MKAQPKSKPQPQIAKARTEGPQSGTRQGKEAVVVIPTEEYEKLTGKKGAPQNLHDFLRQSPLVGVKLDLRRNKGLMRDIEL